MNAEFIINELYPHEFTFYKFDKRWSLPFPYNQYIKYYSNWLVHQAYNIATTQVLPILYISSTKLAALNEIRSPLQPW
jgi:hypothetical protein